MKKNIIYFIVAVFCILNSPSIYAQAKKPKVALVLSGGGAKGVAHIPLLQALDSLGIVPDLIVGTSMGSVIGGFYSMGYSGDSIAQITKSLNWEKLFNGKVSLNHVVNEEKDQYSRSLLSFEVEGKKIKPFDAVFNDQNLRSFLTKYTFPVFNLTNFDSLPIPYRSIAVDIVNGQELVLASGSLSSAMRASMALPGVLTPVNWSDKILLVDGGVLNNFPVDVAKKMKADIIIGSTVGEGLLKKKELDNIRNILFQTSMLASNLKHNEKRQNTDILIDHFPNLTFTTSDFNRVEEIYKQGIVALKASLPKLIDLSEQLAKYEKRIIKIPDYKKTVRFTSKILAMKI